eukprot:4268156-Lingulodinium_polyedra.AAC.1
MGVPLQPSNGEGGGAQKELPGAVSHSAGRLLPCPESDRKEGRLRPALPLDQGPVRGSGEPGAKIPPARVHHSRTEGGGGECSPPGNDALLGDHLRLELAPTGPLNDVHARGPRGPGDGKADELHHV